MTGAGVAGAGLYVPRNRIDAGEIHEAWERFRASGVAEKAVPAADEDALTMGAAAARDALDAAGVDADEVALLAFASTTPPLDEEDLTPRLGEFLGVPADAARRTVGESTRAGVEALLTAADAGRFPALVVAADCPRGEPNSTEEHAAGAGAAAFVLTADGPARLVSRGEHAVDYPGVRFRERGDDAVRGLGITSYDRQAFRECVTGAVDALDDDADGDVDADALALQAPDGKLPGRAASALDLEASLVTVAEDLGDLGAASAPAALVCALADGRETTLVVGYGSGAGATALLIEGTAPVATDETAEREVSYSEYLRLRGEITGDEPAGGGARVSVPSWRRSRGVRYRLEAGRCPDCGELAFPPEGACPGCHELVAFERVELPRTGTVETATGVTPGGAPPEFAVQAAKGGDFGVAVVAFERDGATASVPVQVTDAAPDEVAHGDEVEAVVRRVYTQEGVPRYGVKVRPVDRP